MERLACCSRSSREMEANLDPSSPVLSGGWRFSQFYRRRSSFREEEAQSAPSSSAFGHGGWRLTKLRAAVVESQVFWVEIRTRGSQRLRSQEEEDLRRRLRLFEEEVSGGSRRACLGFPVVHRRKRSRSTIELSDGKTRRRRSPMARRLCRLGVPAKSCDGGKRRWLCEDGATKLRRATRGGRMNQILTRVLLCLLPARPEQARRSVCGLWAMHFLTFKLHYKTLIT
ncbi:LOW QUALITY PROTEIN: hypothetical protein YC2023_076386 [Brassica napus]